MTMRLTVSARPCRREILVLVTALGILPQWLTRAAATARSDAQAVALVVEASGSVPGIKDSDLPRYLAGHMMAAKLPGWRFVASAVNAPPAPNRVQWKFWPNPHAGGSVRYLGPQSPSERNLFLSRRLISIEVRLYLDDQYQRLCFGQARLRGGAEDEALSLTIFKLSWALLGDRDFDG